MLPVLLLALVIAAPALRAQPAQVVFGANLPFFYYGDVGCNAWGCRGYSTEGWVTENRAGARCLTEAQRTAANPISGKPALQINANCIAQDANLSAGEIYTEPLVTQPVACPKQNTVSVLDLSGATITMRLCLPTGAAGPADGRNAIQFFFKSRTGDEFPAFSSAPIPIDPNWEGRCTTIPYELTATSPGERGAGFDVRRIVLAGFRVKTSSTSRLQVPIYLERYTIGGRLPFDYDFDFTQLERNFRAVRDLARTLDLRRIVVRLFLLADGRAGIVYFPDGTIDRLDDRVFRDFDAVVRAAESVGVGLIPVVLDNTWFNRARTVSGVQVGGRSGLLRTRAGIDAFRERVLNPLLTRYGASPAIYAWDIVNEPELVTNGISGFSPNTRDVDPLNLSEMREFVRLAADSVNRLAYQRVTVGSARRSFVTLWRGLGLSLYSMHYYDTDRREVFPWEPSRSLQLDQPVLVTEVPTKNTRYRAGDYLGAAREGGYEGVCMWSCRAQDEFADLPNALADLAFRAPKFDPAPLTNAASLLIAPGIANEAVYSLFGSNLAPGKHSANAASPPESLEGVTVAIRDFVGAERRALLLMVSPDQINFVSPARLLAGPGRITVSRADGSAATTDLALVRVNPGLYSAGADGKGPAAANVTRMRGGVAVSTDPTFRCPGGRCQNVAIDFGPTADELVLNLFATGVRQASNLALVQVRLGTLLLPASFAGPQGQFPGMDQVNVHLPRSLVGKGTIDVTLIAEGLASNTVNVQFR